MSMREGKRGREIAKTRCRRSAIINSARSFLSIVIGDGRGRASLDGRAYSRYYLSFSPSYAPRVYGLANRNQGHGRDKMRITRVEIATAICFYLSGVFVEYERASARVYDVESQLIAITCSLTPPWGCNEDFIYRYDNLL